MSFERILNHISVKLNVKYVESLHLIALKQHLTNTFFKNEYLELTTNLLQNIKQDENNCEIFCKLKLPFEVKPVKFDKFPGLVMLYAGDEVNHEVLVDGYVHRGALHNWIRKISIYAFDPQKYGQQFGIQRSNNPSHLHLTHKLALEFEYTDWPWPKPSLPEEIFKTQSWYALPLSIAPYDEFDKRTFMAWAPNWEQKLMLTNENSVTVFRLMRQLCVANDMSQLSEEILKTFILHELPLESQLGLGEFLIKMWKKLCQHLKDDAKLNHFLLKKLNLICHIHGEELKFLQNKAANILVKLQKCQIDDEEAFKNLIPLFLDPVPIVFDDVFMQLIKLHIH